MGDLKIGPGIVFIGGDLDEEVVDIIGGGSRLLEVRVEVVSSFAYFSCCHFGQCLSNWSVEISCSLFLGGVERFKEVWWSCS